MSSAEAEYAVATATTCHTFWLRILLKDKGHTKKYPSPIFCDNISAVVLSKHHVFHKKNKHLDTRYHLIHELVNNGKNNLQFCGSKEQLANMFNQPFKMLAFDF